MHYHDQVCTVVEAKDGSKYMARIPTCETPTIFMVLWAQMLLHNSMKVPAGGLDIAVWRCEKSSYLRTVNFPFVQTGLTDELAESWNLGREIGCASRNMCCCQERVGTNFLLL